MSRDRLLSKVLRHHLEALNHGDPPAPQVRMLSPDVRSRFPRDSSWAIETRGRERSSGRSAKWWRSEPITEAKRSSSAAHRGAPRSYHG